MHLVDLLKLEAINGFLLEHYRAVTAAADASMHDSPAFLAKAQFEKDWQQRPNELAERVRTELAARAAAAEAAARGG
jgi:hypothetical protein